MYNPLVIEAIILVAAIIVGVWSQRALPLHANSRPILFLLCLFVGTSSALCLLLGGLALLFAGQVATGDVRIYGPLLLLVVLQKPLNGIPDIVEGFMQQRAEKKKGRGQRDGRRHWSAAYAVTYLQHLLHINNRTGARGADSQHIYNPSA